MKTRGRSYSSGEEDGNGNDSSERPRKKQKTSPQNQNSQYTQLGFPRRCRFPLPGGGPCNKSFEEFADIGPYNKHLRISHPGIEVKTCPYPGCGYVDSHRNLNRHMQTHTEKPFHSCNLQTHSLGHNGPTVYHHTPCSPHTNSIPPQPNITFIPCSGEKPFECHKCDYASNQESDLHWHMKNINSHSSPPRPASPPFPGPNKITHTTDFYARCPICKNLPPFYGAGALSLHLKVHHGIFECFLCRSLGKETIFSCQEELDIHKKTVKHFRCTQCNYAYHQPGDLQNHMRTHTRKKSFNDRHLQTPKLGPNGPPVCCDTLGGTNQNNINLLSTQISSPPPLAPSGFNMGLQPGPASPPSIPSQWGNPSPAMIQNSPPIGPSHTVSGQNISQFNFQKQCPICGESFSALVDYSDHQELFHNLLTCSLCYLGFGQQDDLTMHMETHLHKPLFFYCAQEGCNQYFTNKGGLDSHMQDHHLPCFPTNIDRIRSDNLSQHMIKMHPAPPPQPQPSMPIQTCDLCKLSFGSEYEFLMHHPCVNNTQQDFSSWTTPPRSPDYSNQPPVLPIWPNSPPSPPGFDDGQFEDIDPKYDSRRCLFCNKLFKNIDEVYVHEPHCEFRYTE